MAVLVTCVRFLALVVVAGTQECQEPGWFGSSCQYKSRCRTPDCDTTGCCPDDSKCELGYFGPACQYFDLMTRSSHLTLDPPTDTSHLTDNDVRTCLTNTSVKSMNITWPNAHLLTWIRIYTPHNETVTIEARDQKWVSRTLKCSQVRTDTRVLDVVCCPTLVLSVVLSGPAIAEVCSLYVSAGRNVALRQVTEQVDVESVFGQHRSPDLAVDGNTSGVFRCEPNQACSCSSTSFRHPEPWWQVKFNTPKLVYQFIIYNKNHEETRNRLQGFKLLAFNISGSVVFTYRDTEEKPLKQYLIPWTGQVQPVYKVRIQAKSFMNSETNQSLAKLTLCEVEIYGDSVCSPGTHGMDCQHKCSSQPGPGERCDLSPFLCPSACQGGGQCGPHLAGIALPVGVGVGSGLLLICVIVIVVVACRKCNKKKGEVRHEYDTANVTYYTDHYDVLGPTVTPDQTLQKRVAVLPQGAYGNVAQKYEQIDEPNSPHVYLYDDTA